MATRQYTMKTRLSESVTVHGILLLLIIFSYTFSNNFVFTSFPSFWRDTFTISFNFQYFPCEPFQLVIASQVSILGSIHKSLVCLCFEYCCRFALFLFPSFFFGIIQFSIQLLHQPLMVLLYYHQMYTFLVQSMMIFLT